MGFGWLFGCCLLVVFGGEVSFEYVVGYEAFDICVVVFGRGSAAFSFCGDCYSVEDFVCSEDLEYFDF